jgi:hypothetical protein
LVTATVFAVDRFNLVSTLSRRAPHQRRPP